jgi:hypothetical protein
MPSTGSERQHRRCLLVVVEHAVVERAVRLEVAHPGAGRGGDLRQEPHLVRHLLAQHLAGDVPGHPPEVLAVGVGDLGPDRDAEPDGFLADRPHDGLGAGVVAARDVGAADHLEQRGVVGHLLAEVRVEVDPPGTHNGDRSAGR